ncbi:MAG: PHP domain-containing protein [Clostridia bacterium]|nr:PHP domain-containing protein [Clostridia bacterium]
MIDLHIHSTNSDGYFTVLDILKMAQEKNINVISFCDHNVLGAYEDLKKIEIEKYYSGRIITGIEFDFVYEKKVFHMLGYNFDVDKLMTCKYLDRRTEEELVAEEERNLEFFKGVCKKLGIKLSNNLKITKSSEPANDIIKRDMQIHPENQEIMDEVLGKDRKKSFWLGHVTNPDSPFYIDFTKGLPSAEEIASEIHNAGGIVVLPHVFEYKSIDNISFLNEMYKLNILDGIECVHSKHSKEQTQFLIDFCNEHNLVKSGGSDFHTDKVHTLGHTEIGEISDDFCLK